MLRSITLALALALVPALAHAQNAAPADNAHARAAQSPATTTTAPAAAITTTAPAPASADTGAVAVPKPTEEAVRYQNSGTVLWVVDTLWGLLLPLILLFTGLSARIRDLAYRIGRKWYFALVVYGAIVTALIWAVSLPLAYYEGFVREHAYGLSNQTLGKWTGDTVKGLVIGIVTFALVMWVPYLLLRKSPRRWWVWTALAGIPLIVFSIWLEPLVIEPLFNHFGPMHDKQLEQQILGEAARAGIAGSRVFEVNKSVDTKALNAYVTGFGGSKRIVIWDTTLRKMNDREILFVVGHEMGHYVLHHMIYLVAFSIVLLFLFLYLIHLSAGWVIARYRERFRFDALADFASYPLLSVIITVAGLVVTPAILAFTRHLEHEADRFGLELTRDNHAAATAFVKLQSENLSVPYHSTLYKIFQDSHPPLGERIEFSNTYKPWAQGKPLKYGDRFK